jgi:hypothetical protein
MSPAPRPSESMIARRPEAYGRPMRAGGEPPGANRAPMIPARRAWPSASIDPP